MPPIERAARAICRLAGHSENIRFEGRPMWESYVDEAAAALSAVRHDSFIALAKRLLTLPGNIEPHTDALELSAMKEEARKLLLRMQPSPHDQSRD